MKFIENISTYSGNEWELRNTYTDFQDLLPYSVEVDIFICKGTIHRIANLSVMN